MIAHSDNWIAEDLGVHNETVTAKREELEEKGELTETVSSLGKDGKERPRKQKPPKPEAETLGDVTGEPPESQPLPDEPKSDETDQTLPADTPPDVIAWPSQPMPTSTPYHDLVTS